VIPREWTRRTDQFSRQSIEPQHLASGKACRSSPTENATPDLKINSNWVAVLKQAFTQTESSDRAKTSACWALRPELLTGSSKYLSRTDLGITGAPPSPHVSNMSTGHTGLESSFSFGTSGLNLGVHSVLPSFHASPMNATKTFAKCNALVGAT
jgi:hypothetical protein